MADKNTRKNVFATKKKRPTVASVAVSAASAAVVLATVCGISSHVATSSSLAFAYATSDDAMMADEFDFDDGLSAVDPDLVGDNAPSTAASADEGSFESYSNADSRDGKLCYTTNANGQKIPRRCGAAAGQSAASSAAPPPPRRVSRIKLKHLTMSAAFVHGLIEYFPAADNFLRYCGDDSMLFVTLGGIIIVGFASVLMALFGGKTDTLTAEEEEKECTIAASPKPKKEHQTRKSADVNTVLQQESIQKADAPDAETEAAATSTIAKATSATRSPSAHSLSSESQGPSPSAADDLD